VKGPCDVTDSTRWPAPHPTGPVHAHVTVPGSKSMTNRALVLAALADRPGIIAGPLEARDTLLMRRALAALGATIEDLPASGVRPAEDAAAGQHATGAGQAGGRDAPGGGQPSWRVVPGQPGTDISVDVGNAGTVMRFVPPVAALTSVSVAFHGDARASERPVGPVLAALRQLGAVIDDGHRGAFPFTVHGTGSLAGGVVTVDASASSQFVSGLLLAAPRYDKGVEVRVQGPEPPSAPHIAMTVQMLRDAGAGVETWTRGGDDAAERGTDTWRVQPGAIGFDEVIVQPDVSNAVPFLAAALVTGGTVTITGWPAVTSQPAGEIIGLLNGMGARCQLDGDGLAVTGTGSIHGIDASLADASESALVVAALAALADSPSRLTGIGHMRTHETDRLAALAAEINALGGDVTELPDGLAIRPRPLRASGRPFASYDDHRMVMAAAVIGLAVPGLEVQNAATVGKTFPSFTGRWEAMLERAP
jgi:3-phosphoshikimate 1-carboxyvinyltransferase